MPPLKKGNPALIEANWISAGDNIYQMRVLRQGADADCGYHALKNGILLLNAFLAGSDINERTYYLNGLSDVILYNAWHSTWAAAIKKKRNSTVADWLQGNEIEALIKGAFPEEIEHRPEFITVIDNPAWLYAPQENPGEGLLDSIVRKYKRFPRT